MTEQAANESRSTSEPRAGRSIAQELHRLILLSALPFVALIALLAYLGHQGAHSDAEAFVRRQATRVALDVTKFLGETKRGLRLVSGRTAVHPIDATRCDPWLADLVAIQPRFLNVNVIDRDGWVICGATPPSGGPRSLNISDREWFRAVASGQDFALGVPRKGPILGRWNSTAAVPILGPGGAFAGAVVAPIDLVGWEPPGSRGALPDDAVLGVIDQAGTMVMRFPEADKWVGRNNHDAEVVGTMLRVRDGVFDAPGVQGFERIWSVTPIPGTDWLAFAGLTSSAVLGPPLKQTGFAVALALVALAAAAWLSFKASRRLAQPIAGIARAARARTSGSDDLVPAIGPSEIREVAQELNRMIGATQKAQEALRESESRLSSVFQASPIGISVSTVADGKILDVNEAALRLYGYTRDEAIGRTVTELRTYANLAQREELLQQLREHGSIDRFPIDFRHRSGQAGVLELSGRIVDLQSEQCLVAMLLDVTERRRQEQSLAESEKRFRGLIEQSLTGIYISLDGVYQYANPRLEQMLGYGPGDLVGMRAEDIAVAEDVPIVLACREKLRAGASSCSYQVRVRRKDGRVIELGVQGSISESDGELTTIGMAQDITEKKRSEDEIKHYVAQLQTALMSTVNVATTLSEMRDPYTAGHERRVADIAVAIGAELGLDAHRQEGLHVAGHLHDVGKITIPSEILSKPGKLSPIEFQLIQGHAQASYDVLKDVEFPWPVAQVALQHHERLDGSGYPQGLKGEAILFEARIMAVADVVEAMSSHRPYRPGLGIDKALAEIERGRGTAYDRVVADACMKLFREKGYTIPA